MISSSQELEPTSATVVQGLPDLSLETFSSKLLARSSDDQMGPGMMFTVSPVPKRPMARGSLPAVEGHRLGRQLPAGSGSLVLCFWCADVLCSWCACISCPVLQCPVFPSSTTSQLLLLILAEIRRKTPWR